MLDTIKLLYEDGKITKEVCDILIAQMVISTKADIKAYIKSNTMGFNGAMDSNPKELRELLNRYEKIIYTSEGFSESSKNKENLVEGWQQLRATILALYSK
ncbi:MAG: hypothetical protein ACK5HU_01055 [Flavobacteriales bacterium]